MGHFRGGDESKSDDDGGLRFKLKCLTVQDKQIIIELYQTFTEKQVKLYRDIYQNYFIYKYQVAMYNPGFHV